jgi:hypothetical protein
MSSYDPDDCMNDEERDLYDQKYQLRKYKPIQVEVEVLEERIVIRPCSRRVSVKFREFRLWVLGKIKEGRSVADIYNLIEQNRKLYHDYIEHGIPPPEGITIDEMILSCGKSYQVVRYWVRKISGKIDVPVSMNKAGSKPNQFARDYVAAFGGVKSAEQMHQELGISKAAVYKYQTLAGIPAKRERQKKVVDTRHLDTV